MDAALWVVELQSFVRRVVPQIRVVAAGNLGSQLLSLLGALLEAVNIEVSADLVSRGALGVASWQRTQGEADFVFLFDELMLVLYWTVLHGVLVLVRMVFLVFL